MKTVLVVEDDTITFRVLFKILTKRGGFAVNYTENVEEIIQLAQSGEVDIILMDVSLSNSVYQGKSVNSIDITKLLKADEKTANIPIMLMTANARWGSREQFFSETGADDLISQPFVDHQAVIDRVRALLPEDQHLRTARSPPWE